MGQLEKVIDNLLRISDLAVDLRTDLSRSGTLKLKADGNLIKAHTVEALQAAIKELSKNKIEYRPLGLGANSLIEDAHDFFYLKFLPKNSKGILDNIPTQGEIELPGSITLNKLTNAAIKNQLKKWDVFTGVPATLGGAVVMNAGTSLGEIGEIVKSVKYIDSTGELQEHICNKDSFVYRNNSFLNKGDFIYSVTLQTLGQEEGIDKKIQDYLEFRNRTQPLWDKTCGCTFKNYKEGDVVLPAGKYIDLAGLKGLEYGNMKISEKKLWSDF
jgi:UDP-N-acetylmuramate dehydrogenase